MSTTKDLTKEAPRSPRERVGGYAILGRTIDKGRALLENKIGEFHFDCPLDNQLFGFKGVKGGEVKKLLEAHKSDQEIVSWLDSHGTPKTAAEVKAWSGQAENIRPFGDDPEKKAWFEGECVKLGLDPKKATLFEWLEADDKASFGKKA